MESSGIHTSYDAGDRVNALLIPYGPVQNPAVTVLASITEYFLVISPDKKHAQYLTYYCLKLVSEYLRSISYAVHTVHDSSDGCAAHKSRRCLGDLSESATEFNYSKLIRNFIKTSHAIGPQDAAMNF
jgi:hypothetical protein